MEGSWGAGSWRALCQPGFEQSLAKPSPRLILIRLLRGAGDATPAARPGGGCASEGCISQLTSLPASDPASQAVTRPFPKVSAAWRGFNTSSVSPVRIPLHQSIPSLPEHAALSTPLEKPLGAGMGGTAGPYPASPAPRSSGRWTRAPAAGTGGTGSGGSRCSAGAWAGCNLGCGGEGLSILAS